MIGKSPDKSFAPSLSEVQENLSNVEEKLITSSIPRRCEVRTLVSELSSALAQLMASEKEPKYSKDCSSHSHDSYAKTKKVDLPRIALPNFHGDIMEWTSFWNQFQTIVDSNNDLDTSSKLAYLRDAVKDPRTLSPLKTNTKRAFHYDEMVQLLHRHFDKKRIIHKNYLWALVYLPPVTRETRRHPLHPGSNHHQRQRTEGHRTIRWIFYHDIPARIQITPSHSNQMGVRDQRYQDCSTSGRPHRVPWTKEWIYHSI